MIQSRPELYLDELAIWLFQITGKRILVSTVCRYILRLGFTRQKLSTIAYERDAIKRAEFIHFIGTFPINMLYFIDECSKDNRMTNRHYGYFERGCKSPSVLGNFIKRHRVSVLAGLSHGIEGIHIVDGSYNTDPYNFALQHSFLNNVGSFVNREDRSIVVLDNCRIHDSDEFIDMVRMKGGIVVCLPPYSPDMNPIELAFNYVKSWLERNRDFAEAFPKLAICQSLLHISANDARGFFSCSWYQ